MQWMTANKAAPKSTIVITNPTFLVLDDDDDTRYLSRHALKRGFPGARVIESSCLDHALEVARHVHLDGVLTDHHLGTDEGPSMVGRLREAGVACPVVMVTSSSDPKIFKRAYQAGAARVFAGSDFDFVGYFRAHFQRAE